MPTEPIAPRVGGTAVAGHCVDIDGNWWHEPGSCTTCRPLCCEAEPAPRPIVAAFTDAELHEARGLPQWDRWFATLDAARQATREATEKYRDDMVRMEKAYDALRAEFRELDEHHTRHHAQDEINAKAMVAERKLLAEKNAQLRALLAEALADRDRQRVAIAEGMNERDTLTQQLGEARECGFQMSAELEWNRMEVTRLGAEVRARDESLARAAEMLGRLRGIIVGEAIEPTSAVERSAALLRAALDRIATCAVVSEGYVVTIARDALAAVAGVQETTCK